MKKTIQWIIYVIGIIVQVLLVLGALYGAGYGIYLCWEASGTPEFIKSVLVLVGLLIGMIGIAAGLAGIIALWEWAKRGLGR